MQKEIEEKITRKEKRKRNEKYGRLPIIRGQRGSVVC
jgi:hypothetical protein